jgi:mono/diheme cytochrome c family protein
MAQCHLSLLTLIPGLSDSAGVGIESARMNPRAWLPRFAALVLTGMTACAKPAPPSVAESPQVAAGRQVFVINCSSCHNINPTLDGSLGPAIAGSPRALVAARVLHQAYPPGYKPKRVTHLMRPLP